MNDLQKQIAFWGKSADNSWAAALSLFKNKHYDACLFFCHLAIEKMLKGLVLQETKQTPPFIHDLERLAKIANIFLSDKQAQDLKTITKFNIAGRYSEAKLSFYEQCTKSYTEKHLKLSTQIFIWLEKLYHNQSDKK